MFLSIAEWFETAERQGVNLAEAVLRWEANETGVDGSSIRHRIEDTLAVMRRAVDEGLASAEESPTRMTGGRARRLAATGPRLLGDDFTAMLARAIATLEVNARMGLIVAAPTAGAAGVVPGVLLTLRESRAWSAEDMVNGMLVAGGTGAVIADRASIAGAGGGCQAETGSGGAPGAPAGAPHGGGGAP
ncbi:MAG: L-serine ammonia-lyase, iron-sulfur-dependent, subunit beta, partial [Gemmatimonadota bacterium]